MACELGRYAGTDQSAVPVGVPAPAVGGVGPCNPCGVQPPIDREADLHLEDRGSLGAIGRVERPARDSDTLQPHQFLENPTEAQEREITPLQPFPSPPPLHGIVVSLCINISQFYTKIKIKILSDRQY